VTRWNASTPPLPFVEVINSQVDLDDMPDLWGSALLEVESRADVTMGSNPQVEEAGRISVTLVAKSGDGVAVLDSAVTWLRATFHGWKSGDLIFTAVHGPVEMPEAEGGWWPLGFLVPYTIQSRRVEPVP
jgi:hypothetical protein